MTETEAFRIPNFEIAHRIGSVQSALGKTPIDGLIILQRVDLFYFSGTAQNAILYIPAIGEPLLMVKRYYPRAVCESSIQNIIEIKSVKEVPDRIRDIYGGLPKTIGMETDVIPVRDFHFYASLFSGSTLVDGVDPILETRMIKSEWEIRQLRATARLSRDTFEFMKAEIKPGLSEMEFAALAEAFARKHGHGGKMRVRDFQTEGYAWHVLSGKNSALVGLLDSPASGAGTSAAFPSGAGWKPLESNEPILVDFATIMNGYHMDETRMFAIGAMPKKALDASQAAIDIHNSILDRIKPGMTGHEIFEYSQLLASKTPFRHAFLGPPGYQVPFVGHSIGLELIESPLLARGKHQPLKPGMAFALEPKIVIENEFMAGVESVFEVTETGTRLISEVPVEIFVR